MPFDAFIARGGVHVGLSEASIMSFKHTSHRGSGRDEQFHPAIVPHFLAIALDSQLRNIEMLTFEGLVTCGRYEGTRKRLSCILYLSFGTSVDYPLHFQSSARPSRLLGG